MRIMEETIRSIVNQYVNQDYEADYSLEMGQYRDVTKKTARNINEIYSNMDELFENN